MKFNLNHDPAKKTLSVPCAALQLAGFDEQSELALHVEKGCILLLPREMTAVEQLETLRLMTEVSTALLVALAARSIKERGAAGEACKGCHWEEQCFEGKILFCALAEAGIDPEEPLEYEIRGGQVTLKPEAETETYKLMSGLEEDFRSMLSDAGVSLPGLFLALRRELDDHE